MALATLAECKAYCRIQTTTEDAVHTSTLASARALLEAYVGAPLVKQDRTDVDYASSGRLDRAVDALILERKPASNVVVTNGEGVTVDAATYRVDARAGIIRAIGCSFPFGPYTIAYKWGMDAHPEYTTLIEPVMNQCLKDLFAILHQQRSPGATREGGGRSAVDWSLEQIAPGLAMRLTPWRNVGVAIGGST